MRNILKFLITIIVILFGTITLYKFSKENETMISIIEYYTREHTELIENEYKIKYNNSFVSLTNNFVPKNKEDLLNIYYTVLSSGMNEFTFYCDINYIECINDVKALTSNDMLLSHVNGFVHVYNSYTTLSTEYKNNGKITLKVSRLYTEEMINKIDKEVKKIYKKLYRKDKTIKENLRIIHDYIIDNTKYDLKYVENKTDRMSNTAYAPLFDGYAICSGYTDLMSLFLYEIGIHNIRVSNETHTWNLITLDNQKLVIDLTYDDPVSTDGKDNKRHTYFLITSEELQKLDKDHAFNKDIYLK